MIYHNFTYFNVTLLNTYKELDNFKISSIIRWSFSTHSIYQIDLQLRLIFDDFFDR